MRAYQPSNGTEGHIFMEHYCMQCIHCDPNPEGVKQCNVLMRSMAYNVKDPEYPREWVYVNDKPTCTKWSKWDWGNNGDPDDPSNPKAPTPPPPANQLMIPYDVWDLLGVSGDILVTQHAVIDRGLIEQ